MSRYAVGSDPVTVRLAKEACAKVDAQIQAGNFVEAERLIDVFCNAANRPFRAEFVNQAEAAE